jgi:predicted dehydrogenase
MIAPPIYRVAIIGLGQIALRYDIQAAPDGIGQVAVERVTTHTKAFSLHPGFSLVAAIDASSAALAEFSQYYSAPTYSTLAEAFAEQSIDLVVLAVPTALHFNCFIEALRCGAKAIICEKPLANSLHEASQMLRLAKQSGIYLGVNYIRPTEPATANMLQRVAAGELGAIQKVFVRYVKGLANNASHFINLCQQLWGAPTKISVLQAGAVDLADPEPDFLLVFDHRIAVYFFALDVNCYTLAEMDIFGSKGAVYYRNLGGEIIYADVAPHMSFSSSLALQAAPALGTDLLRYQWHAAEYCYQQLQQQPYSYAQAEGALLTWQIIEAIKTQAKPARLRRRHD